MDRHRVTQFTESHKQKKKTGQDADYRANLHKVDGYNIDQLMSDMRFKLQSCLADAGISSAKYAT